MAVSHSFAEFPNLLCLHLICRMSQQLLAHAQLPPCDAAAPGARRRAAPSAAQPLSQPAQMACTRLGSFCPSPPTQLCAERACHRLPRAAGSSRRRGQPWQKHMPCSTPVQPGLDGDDNLDIGSVEKDCLDELDAGSDDGRSTDLPSMLPSRRSLRNAMHRVLMLGAARARRARRACRSWQQPAASALRSLS